MVATNSLSAHQFGEPVAKPIASSEDQIDLSWADRDLDPVLSASATPVSPVKSPSQTLSQMKGSAGYTPENFRT
jgi:hypothetical protein